MNRADRISFANYTLALLDEYHASEGTISATVIVDMLEARAQKLANGAA